MFYNGCAPKDQDDEDDDGETTPVDDHKVTICHATGSASNPFVVISPSASGVFHGHMGHQDGRDIIPPFTYNGQTYSQNWDAAGQALYNNGCAPEDEVDVPPTDEECPEGTMESEDGECVVPTTTTIPVEEECPAGTMENEDGECVTPPTDTTLPPVDEGCPAGTMENEDGECVTPPTDTTVPPTDTTTPDDVLGEIITRGGVGGATSPERVLKAQERKPLAVKAANRAQAQLPFTGSNILMLLTLAFGLLGLGLLSLESSILFHNASIKKARR
jgi:hypothetical protein